MQRAQGWAQQQRIAKRAQRLLVVVFGRQQNDHLGLHAVFQQIGKQMSRLADPAVVLLALGRDQQNRPVSADALPPQSAHARAFQGFARPARQQQASGHAAG